MEPAILISILSLLIILIAVYFVRDKRRNLKHDPRNYLNKIQFTLGICISLIGAGIMFHGNIFGEKIQALPQL